MKKRFVIVTTDKDRKGVFAGDLVEHDKMNNTVVLENAQMAVYWGIETQGVLGLASSGPQNGSRITPIIPRIELNGVTSIMDTTKLAESQWKKQLWG